MNGAKNYTAKDIERYHSGALSAAEMHALEKAALDDPFLADALEGYAFAQTPAADNAALQQRLQQRIGENEKRRGLFYIGNNWLKIAALFVLIAGGGWLTFRLFTSEPATDLATSKQVQNQTPTEGLADSVTVTASDAPVTTQTTVADENKVLVPQRPPEQNATVQRELEAVPTVIPPSAFGRRVADSLQNEVYAARERSVAEERQKDLYQKAEALSKSHTDAATKMDTIRNFNIAMQRDTTGLTEVVVGYGQQKRTAPPRPRAAAVVVDTLEPAGGWTRFDDYVASNLKEPEELKAKGVKGEVELSFEVNKEGEPVNITVTKPLCEKCDEEAIRLLKEGPKWKKGKKKGKVKIKIPMTQ